jgi:hypothetical protein
MPGWNQAVRLTKQCGGPRAPGAVCQAPSRRSLLDSSRDETLIPKSCLTVAPRRRLTHGFPDTSSCRCEDCQFGGGVGNLVVLSHFAVAGLLPLVAAWRPTSYRTDERGGRFRRTIAEVMRGHYCPRSTENLKGRKYRTDSEVLSPMMMLVCSLRNLPLNNPLSGFGVPALSARISKACISRLILACPRHSRLRLDPE